MTMNARLRLGRLETIWPAETTPEMPPWIPRLIEAAAEAVELLALRRQAWARGQRRRLAEGGPYPDHDEYADVVNHELEELTAYARLTPGDPGKALSNWYEGAEGWPASSSWPFSLTEWARDIEDHRWRKEEARSCPALQPYQTELRAEMARLEPVTSLCQWLTTGVVRST